MPSTHKTSHLNLNQWLGTDKPKKDDFNGDNEKIDAAIAGLAAAVEGGSPALDAHIADVGIHVTAAEKELWGSGGSGSGGGGGGPVIGTYTGTGTTSRSVPFGFKPRYGFLFAVGLNAVDGDWGNNDSNVYAGFFSEAGCSRFLTVTDTGLTVKHNSSQPLNGCASRFNSDGQLYVYVAWE